MGSLLRSLFQPTASARARLKICCIADEREAQTAIHAGADVLGLVSAMPSGPGPIREEQIRAVARAVEGRVITFLLTALRDADAIIEQHRRCGTSAIQLVDEVAVGAYERIRGRLPGIGIVQVIHVENESAVASAALVAPHVDALLLDSGRPTAPTPELGGTGRVHNWSISREIVSSVARPVFLAGGLRPDNLRQARAQVSPFGFDICSGVRTDGRLDPAKLEAVIRALGDSEVSSTHADS
ncbi:MAG: phosphoribosylanthranilate isomerase [Planctomycetes bacterium]|nr:phosphoribosylanthranilate isomerase [Planctomycetota bacterium]